MEFSGAVHGDKHYNFNKEEISLFEKYFNLYLRFFFVFGKCLVKAKIIFDYFEEKTTKWACSYEETTEVFGTGHKAATFR